MLWMSFYYDNLPTRSTAGKTLSEHQAVPGFTWTHKNSPGLTPASFNLKRINRKLFTSTTETKLMIQRK
jgi:hypothetical protein